MWTVVAFAIAAAATLALFVVARALATRVLDNETRIVTNQLGARIRSCVETRVEMITQMRRESELGGLHDDAAFEARVEALLRTFPGYLAVNRIDASGVIRFVYPKDANRAALGRNLADTPDAHAVWKDAVADGAPRLSPPVELFQAGTGVTVYVALPSLTLNGVFRTETLITACLGPERATAYAIAITDGDKLVFQRGGDLAEEAVTASTDLPLYNRMWTMRVTPLVDHAAAAFEPTRLILVNGLLLAIAIGVLVFVLLTIRARAHSRDRAAAARVQRLQRMEALGQMAAGVAHDFNNLLTVVLTSAHMAREHPTDGQALTDIEDAAKRGVGLTRQLVAFGRGDEGPMIEVDLAAHVRGMRSMLTRFLDTTHTLELRVVEGSAIVLGSTVQFEQILVNLVVNAVAAMPKGGTVTVEVTRTDGRIGLVVADTGVGIAPDVLPRIYEPFFTTKGDGEGSGLGLATVFSHVHRMNGQLEVTSELGKGTRFAMTFPAASARSL